MLWIAVYSPAVRSGLTYNCSPSPPATFSREEQVDGENLPEDISSRSEGASWREVELSDSLLGVTVLRKAIMGMGKSNRSEKIK